MLKCDASHTVDISQRLHKWKFNRRSASAWDEISQFVDVAIAGPAALLKFYPGHSHLVSFLRWTLPHMNVSSKLRQFVARMATRRRTIADTVLHSRSLSFHRTYVPPMLQYCNRACDTSKVGTIQRVFIAVGKIDRDSNCLVDRRHSVSPWVSL